MVSAQCQMLGAALAIVGWIGIIVTCALPQWRVTVYISEDLTTQTIWEGIWMICTSPTTGQRQCKAYGSKESISWDIQAARALIVIAILIGFTGILLSLAKVKCTIYMAEKNIKSKIGIASGIAFIVAGVLCLIPLYWVVYVIIGSSNSLLLSSAHRNVGSAVFVGLAATALLTVGGGTLLGVNCSSTITTLPGTERALLDPGTTSEEGEARETESRT